MTFTRPVVGPKVYLSRGTSGQAETFKRCEADTDLKLFLGSVTSHLAIDGFIRKMLLERKIETWTDVLDYLAGLVKVDVEHVPLEAAVSFWAQVDLQRAATKRAKLEVGN
jgi:hypothetical protein